MKSYSVVQLYNDFNIYESAFLMQDFFFECPTLKFARICLWEALSKKIDSHLGSKTVDDCFTHEILLLTFVNRNRVKCNYFFFTALSCISYKKSSHWSLFPFKKNTIKSRRNEGRPFYALREWDEKNPFHCVRWKNDHSFASRHLHIVSNQTSPFQSGIYSIWKNISMEAPYVN